MKKIVEIIKNSVEALVGAGAILGAIALVATKETVELLKQIVCKVNNIDITNQIEQLVYSSKVNLVATNLYNDIKLLAYVLIVGEILMIIADVIEVFVEDRQN